MAFSLLLIDLDNLFSAEVRRQLNPLLHSRPYTTFGHISSMNSDGKLLTVTTYNLSVPEMHKERYLAIDIQSYEGKGALNIVQKVCDTYNPAAAKAKADLDTYLNLFAGSVDRGGHMNSDGHNFRIP